MVEKTGVVERRKDKSWSLLWNDRVLNIFTEEYEVVGSHIKEIDMYQVTPNGIHRHLANEENDFSGDLETVSEMMDKMEEMGYIREYSNKVAPNYDVTGFDDELYNELGMTIRSIEASKERERPSEIARYID